MRKFLFKCLVYTLTFAIITSFYGYSQVQAAVSAITLENIYELPQGSNIDAAASPDGDAFVVYERSGSIYLTKNRDDEVFVGAGTSPCIALDNSGTPHIAYINSGSVMYETFDGDWENEVNVGIGTSASYVDMDMDSNSKAHIFMRARHYPDNYGWVDLLYITNANGAFEIIRGWNGDRDYSSSGSWGGYYYDSHPISIAIDNNDNYHLFFYHASVWVWYADRDWSYSLQYHTNIDGASKNLGGNHTLYKNSLAVDALGRANVLYGGIKHGLITGGTWSETSLTTASNPSIASNSSAIAIAYTSSGINYYENNGVGMGQTIQIDSQGDNPAVALNDSNRFVYYIKDGKIYLATDKTINNLPTITGAEDGGIYNGDKTISWDFGTGELNGVPVSSPCIVSAEGEYTLSVTEEAKIASISFAIDKTAPVITINPYVTTPTNQDITVTVSTNEGTLNTTTHTFTVNGSFEFVATDAAGNQSSHTVTINNIDKKAPTITIDSYNFSPTNQDITVTASTDEGTLNTTYHTFTENGSFDFIATDDAGNTSTYTVTISNIDKTVPIITVNPYTKDWTNQDVIVSASTNEGTLNANSHVFTENGVFDFIATDDAGNQSTTTVMVDNIDKIKPVGTAILTPSNGSHIRGSATFEIDSSDYESGIAKVELFSSKLGKIAEDTEAPYEIYWDTTQVSDGLDNFWVSAYDHAGNKIDSSPLSIVVDNTAPIINIQDYNTAPTNQDISVTATSNEGTLNASSHTFSQNGSFDFVATDLAGNQTVRTVTISNINKEAPVITINPYNTSPTNQDIAVTASTNKGTLNASSHTFSENSSFEFVATDEAGNTASKTVTISNIDKIAPIITIQPFPIAPTNQNINVIASTNEGTLNASSHTFSENGSFEFIATDEAGNTASRTVIISNIDKTSPIINILPYETLPTNQDVTVLASTNEGTLNANSHTFTDNGSFNFIATDEAGNMTTETVTISHIDKTGPAITINPYSTAPTNQDITVTASVSEGTLNTSSHTFSENGSFEFIATDDLGNSSSQMVTISNIDKTSPKGSIISIIAGKLLRSFVLLSTNTSDDGSGVERVEFYHASAVTLIGTATSSPFSINWDTTKLEDGAHKVWSVTYDRAGNSTISEKIDIEIDNTAPIITISDYSKVPTSESITITASVNEGTLNANSHTFTENGSFEFVAFDSAGNSSTKIVAVNNIYPAQTSTNVQQNPALENTAPVENADRESTGDETAITIEDTGDPELTQELETDIADDDQEEELAINDTASSEVKGESTKDNSQRNWLWIIILGVAAIASAIYIVRPKKT